MADFIPLGSFNKTTTLAASSTAENFTNPGPYTSFIVAPERKVHLKREADATTDDVMILADSYALITLDKGDILSVILADGETDGVVRVTEVAA